MLKLLRACRHDGFFTGAKIGDGGFAEKAEDDGVTAGRQLLLDGGVAHDSGDRFEPALPTGLGRVANEQALRSESGCDQHGLSDALEVGPARDDADKIGGMRRHVAL